MARRNQKRDCQTREDAQQSIVPAGTPIWITADLIELTIRTWQPHYRDVITPEEAVTMIMGVSRLSQILSSDQSS